MDKFEKILEIIEDHRVTVDKIFSDYQKAEQKARTKYSPEGFAVEFMVGEYPKYAGRARSCVDLDVEKVKDIFDQARTEFNQWMMKPVKPDVLQTLDYVRKFGLRLSRTELQVIEKEVSDSYFGRKIFSAIAKDNGFITECVDADSLLESLDCAEDYAEEMILAYAGRGGNEGFPGKDLIEHRIQNGIDYGEYSLPEMAIAASPTKNSSLDIAKNLWGKMKAPFLYTLSPEETKNLGKKIDGLVDRWGDIDQKGADKLREEVPDILSRLESMPKNNDNVDALKKYYVLGNVDSKKQQPEETSTILASAEAAQEYVKSKLGVADTKILDQY